MVCYNVNMVIGWLCSAGEIRFDKTFNVIGVCYQNAEKIGESLEMETGTQVLGV